MADQTLATLDRGTTAMTQFQNMEALADRLRQLAGQAHIISPPPTFMAPYNVAAVTPVVIDPSFDPDSGAGADVYHQPSIHKKASGRALEVSLNANGLKRILAASGVRVRPSRRLDDGSQPYYWVVSTDGTVRDFSGMERTLPSGTVEVDFRDGSAQIGEWTPEEWAALVVDADKKKAAMPEGERWKVKPNINGWTADRVMRARQHGYRMAETKSLNALIRNLGLKQKYTIEELKKPFMVVQSIFVPPVDDPDVRRMVVAHALGATQQLYPGTTAHVALDGPTSHALGDPTQTLSGEVVHDTTPTAPPPADAEEVHLDEPAPPTAPTASPQYRIMKVLRRGTGADVQYFIEARPMDAPPPADGTTPADVTLFTTDNDMARACAKAVKDGQPRHLVTERVQVQGQTYQQLMTLSLVGGGLKL